jgi:anaerobic selenocysteine-containing dehydrogenase
MLVITSTNPLMTHPDVNTNIKAFKKLGFIAVISYHLDNPSARYADIVLPKMHAAFEGRDAWFGGGSGPHDLFVTMPVNLNGNYFVYKQKCAEPPGEVKSRGEKENIPRKPQTAFPSACRAPVSAIRF